MGATIYTRIMPEWILHRMIRREYPNVRQLSTEELKVWLNEGENDDIYIYDIRNKEEYDVSHLKNAMQIDMKMNNDDIINMLPKDKSLKIVCYCSVGMRSTIFADRLSKFGYTNVYNLEGSIFKWINEGRNVYCKNNNEEEVQTQFVHPYDKNWGRYVNESYRMNL